MSFRNFIPTVWAEAINRDLERSHVFVADTNRQYEGSVSKAGDTVRILGITKPTITTQVGTDVTLSTPEVVPDSSVSMIIDHVSYFNYMVDDIDKRQAVGGIMDALSKETSEALANEMDVHVANLAKDKLAVVADNSATAVTTANILNYIDVNLQKLYEKDVTPSTEITMTVPPWFYTKLKQAYIKLDTDNSQMIENGRVGRYGNIIVRMSNNVATNGTGANKVDLIQLKTKRALAFAKPMTHTEAYRPESRFSDAVKGFVLYGSKIVRPKEMIVMNCKPGTESN
jgi:hypothetical protein